MTAAQSYDAWGHRDAQAPGSPNHPTDLQWAGGWGYQTEWSNGASEPGLGLDYLQQRYYDPVVGRFISPDPLGFAGGLNLYGYADDDPVNGVDPSGFVPERRWVEPTRGDQLPVDDPNGIVCRPPSRGLAPLDVPGRPIPLHHRDQRPEGPIDELTRAQHAENGNHGALHQNPESEVCHGKEWEKWKRDYWRGQWDKGRFNDLPVWRPNSKWAHVQEPGLREDWETWGFIILLLTDLVAPEGLPVPVPDEPLPLEPPQLGDLLRPLPNY